MSNAMRKNNQLIRHKQKYEFSLFAVHILGSTKNNLSYWFVRSYIPHLLKNGIGHSKPELDEHTFFEKRKQVHGKIKAHATFCITIYRSIKCTSKSKFQKDVRQIP